LCDRIAKENYFLGLSATKEAKANTVRRAKIVLRICFEIINE
jgi:hypothetical protein